MLEPTSHLGIQHRPQIRKYRRGLQWSQPPGLLLLIIALFGLLALPRQAVAEIIPEGCNFNGINIALGVDKPTAHVGDTLLYSLVVGNSPFPSCRAEQITANITTPDGVVHPITLNRTVLNPGESDSYLNVVSYVVRAQDVKNGIVVGSANLAAVINQNIVNENATSFKDVNTVIVSPCISITATCQGGATPTSLITFEGSVRNCGNIRLLGVVVSNLVNGITVKVAGPFDLNPGQEAPFTGSFAGDPCLPTTATLTTLGRDDVTPAQTVSASTDITCSLASNPQIVLTRSCPEVPALAGGTYQYSGTVQNTGDITLRNIRVTSDRPSANTVVFTLEQLAPGASADFTGSYTTVADACSTTDTLAVTARDLCDRQTVTDSKTQTCPLSAAGQIELTVACPSTPVAAGDVLTVPGTVRNPGNVTLQNIVVVNDGNPGTPVFTLASLAPGASANFTASVSTVANSCEVSAAFTATSADRCGAQNVRDTAGITCQLTGNPVIVVTHDCGVEPPVSGGSGNFTGSVRNAGTVTLTQVTVVNGSTTVFGPATLAPGATETFTGTFSAPADTCSVTTSVTARGLAACNDQEVTSTSTKTCPVVTTPGLEVTKNCPAGVAVPGSEITYTGSVKNVGNVTLVDVIVTGARGQVFGPSTLAPGASATFSGTALVPANVCEITDSFNATAKDKCSGVVVTDSATTTCPVQGTPQVDLTIVCPNGNLTPGGVAKYSGTVFNPGGGTVKDIVVVNANAPGTPVFTVASLAPGASANFTFDVSVPTDVCSIDTTLTVTAADACGASGVSDSSTVSCPVASSPAIAVTQNCPATPAVPGAVSVFSGRVSNTGNITLTNVVVVSKLAGTTPVFGPVQLAPGQSADFSGSYVIPTNTAGCTYESLVTATGADKCTARVVTADNRTTCSIATSPGLQITFGCASQPSYQGQETRMRGKVKNTGTITLQNVWIYNALTGGILFWAADSMAPGEERDFYLDVLIPRDCCTVTASVRVEGVDACSKERLIDTATSTCPVLFRPAIAVTKVCPTDAVEEGDTMVVTGTVSNPGDVTLVGVTLVNHAGGEPQTVLGPITLAPNQVVNYKASFTVPGDFCGDSVIVATGHPFCNDEQSVTASAATRCTVRTAPMIWVDKFCPTLPVSAGNLFTYSGRVINLGNVTLTNVTVVNSQPAPNTAVFGPITLAPGASAEFTGSYTMPDVACESIDVLTARGRDRCTGLEVQNTGSSICPVLHAPMIEVTKQSNGGKSFSGIVRNTGGVPLANVVVKAETVLLGPIELAPGETASYSGTTTTTADVPVEVTGISVCQEIPVLAQATLEGPVTTPLSIDNLRVNGGFISMSWKSVPGRFYRVESKSSVTDADWESVSDEVQATGSTTEKTSLPIGGSSRVYRVIQIE